jgi:uncharacterized protein YybS (DUF2232 family)
LKETKNITEGAALLGIYVLLLLMTIFIPFIGAITLFALAVPFVVYTVRNGWKAGVWFLVIANILTIIFGSPVALTLSVPASTAGVLMGHLFSRNSSRYAILGAATGVFLANYVLAYVTAIVLFNIDFMELLNEMMEESIAASEAMVSSLGQQDTTDTIAQLKEYLDTFAYLLPTLLVATSFINAFVTQLLSGLVLKRLKVKVSTFPPFREMVLPKSLLWYYLIVLVLSMTGIEEGTTGYIAVLNLSVILMFLMTVQGLSFVFFFCHRKKITKAVPITILILSFLLPPLLYIIRMVGIVDIGFQLRERIQTKK